MLFDILRFNLFATDILDPSSSFNGESIGSYLHRNNYSESFMDSYLIPLSSALWSNDPDKIVSLTPAAMLIRFLWNHHMLNSFEDQLQWLTIKGGCHRYVDAILAQTPAQRVHTSTKVLQVRSENDKVVLALEGGTAEYFDRVIIATHAPQALELRGPDSTVEERRVLQKFKTTSSSVVLHSDLSVRSTPYPNF
jgi:predicted NAD/FAD-binding protein